MCKKLETPRFDIKGDSQNWCAESRAEIRDCPELVRQLHSFIQDQSSCTKECIKALQELAKLNEKLMECQQELQIRKQEVISLQYALAGVRGKSFEVEIYCYDSNGSTCPAHVATLSRLASTSIWADTAFADIRAAL